MHPAEFKTLTESVGLDLKDVSMMSLVPEATLKSWLLGPEAIPDGVAGLMRDIDREVERRLHRAAEKVAERETVTLVRFKNPLDFKKAGPDMAPIPVMLAYKCHGALITRLYGLLKREGKAVAVRFWQPPV
ncbi:YdiL family protein [Kordiimonas aestuarii]|uniref:YdiL family protein n=1 Tax=Kordiimonas aestuarii TaxID=1005925 RepID=UPI0021D2E698|nr:YdiL family protein [Kordiimonas aestuarii]